MAKKKKGSADKVLSKKKNVEMKANPFEVKLNKQKHDILGKKVSKFDKGAPGLSRSKAMKKRKEKLLKELKQKDSANVFIDKRLGENDPSLSVEEKMTQRFALEKKRSREKTSLFNLDEDIELTHYGQSLAEMEKFEAPEISDEDDLDQGNLDGDVSAELFGGFLKKSGEKVDDKPWKERLQEIISKSKKAKHERQTERDQAIEMTEKLDQQWKELQALFTGSKKRQKIEEPTREVDDYDITVRELKFEIKGTPSDRMKTEEEIAQEEVERLQKLEADRQRRMKGVIEEETAAQSHISADDLSDCYTVDKKFRQVLKYQDGKVCGEASEDSENEDGNEGKTDEEEKSEQEDEGLEEDASGDEEDDEASDADSFADIESDDDDDDKKSQTNTDKTECKKPDGETKTKSAQGLDLKARKEVMEAARKELPYTFEVPGSFEELVVLLQEHSATDQLVILLRMKQCNHPSLAEGNRQKLECLFSLLLEYIGLAVESDPPQLRLVDSLTPLLYDLCQLSPAQCAQAMLQVIHTHQGEFQIQAEGKIRGFPTLDVLIHLKLVSVLFPTSDFRHSVVTPTMLFMSQLLSQSPVVHERDAAAGLYLCTLVYEYVNSSKRYFPEAINFLRGLLFLAAEKSKDTVEPVLPPFKPVGKSIDLLKVEKTELSDISLTECLSISNTLSSYLFKSSLNTDEFRVRMISSCLDLSLQFSQLYEELSAHAEIFQPLDYMMGKLPQGVSELLKEKISSFREHIAAVKSRTRKYLTMQSKKPQPLKMFEPKIETIFDGKKKRSGGDKEYNERQRLIHKHRREMKGAIREIRRDVQFIGRQQLDAQIQKDKERKKRVREIHQMLAEQEGDFKAMKRKKKT